MSVKKQMLTARVPTQLIQRLDVAARLNYRSRSAEVKTRLESTFQDEGIPKHGVTVAISKGLKSDNCNGGHQ